MEILHQSRRIPTMQESPMIISTVRPLRVMAHAVAVTLKWPMMMSEDSYSLTEKQQQLTTAVISLTEKQQQLTTTRHHAQKRPLSNQERKCR